MVKKDISLRCVEQKKKLYKVRYSGTETSEHEEYEMNVIFNKNIYALQVNKWKIKLEVNKASVNFKIDSVLFGAECFKQRNIMKILEKSLRFLQWPPASFIYFRKYLFIALK